MKKRWAGQSRVPEPHDRYLAKSHERQKACEPRKYPGSTTDIPGEAARTRKMDGGIDWHQHRISQRNSVHQAAEGGQAEVQRPVEE